MQGRQAAASNSEPAFLLFLYFIQAPSLVVGATHSQGGFCYPHPEQCQTSQWTNLSIPLSPHSHTLDPASSGDHS